MAFISSSILTTSTMSALRFRRSTFTHSFQPHRKQVLKTNRYLVSWRAHIPNGNMTKLLSNPRKQLLACTISPSPTSNRTVLSVISTIVGVCVLIGSVLYKVPQVVRVVRRRSAAGISVLMYALETLGTTFSAVYFVRRAFPFPTYGETVFIMVQNFIILLLIVYYEKLPKIPAIACAVLYIFSLFLLFSSFVPMKAIMILQVCSIPILNLARVPQIILNWRRKGTGELSPITLGLQLLGNVARIFTTVAQVRDLLMFVSICVATCFNSTLFGQWIYYSKRRPAVPKQAINS